jgi:hypothetical protein
MLGETIFLQPFGFSGGSFGNLLSKLGELGFFDYVLPFLIIFSMVFAILTRIKIFEDNKAVNAIIALSVGLMALQFGFVSAFFSEIFPRVGIGITIILVVLVFLGLFMDPDRGGSKWMMFGIGAIIVVVILVQTAEATSWWYSGGWWQDNIVTILVLGAFVAVVGIIVGATSSPSPSPGGKSPLERALRGVSS